MSTAIGPPPVTTTDEYSDVGAAVFDFRGTPYVWGYLNIVGNAVLVSLLVGSDQGQTDWSIDYPVFSGFLPLSAGGARPGNRPGDAIYGIRVRALAAGAQAQISGAFFQAGETGIVPGATGTGAVPCPCGSTLIVTDGIVTVSPTAEIDFTSGAVVTDLGGGVAGVAIAAAYVPPTAWQLWTDVGTVAEGASIDLTWADPVTKLPDESGGLPFPFLDLSNEVVPSPLVSGIYAVEYTLQMNGTPSAVAGALVTARGDYAQAGANVPRNLTLPVGPQPVMTPQFPYFVESSITLLIEAGDTWAVEVTNPTGTGKSISVGWVTTVQRIT